MSTPKVKVLDKALFILSFFYDHDELSLKEIEKLSNLNETTIFRILKSFTDWEYLKQDPITKKYRMSVKIIEMTGTMLKKMNLLQICRPYLLEIRDATGESSCLGVLDDFSFIVLDWEPSYYDAHIKVTVGKIVPSYCTAAGRAILAFLPEEEINNLLQKHTLKRYTENTITEKDELRKILRESAERGYAVSKEEYDYDIVVVAVPVFNIYKQVIASCCVAALKSRIKSNRRIEELGNILLKITAPMSNALSGVKTLI